ncbi:MarR family transcriptional regulator [Acrocarpospora sp. B8E8]|uniref:MarR family winged helix-turn-helix transcriptional regulator n=1 Tax=Acrocarpospora sp. B8E8 TaxID=3153572 RepID=UPI00325EEEA6
MIQKPDNYRFGELLARPPEELTVDETARALRIPITTLGHTLRVRTAGLPMAPAQARVLSQLSAGDALTVSVLAQSQELAVSSMTEVVGRLAEAGLVTKTVAAEDRREVRVAITEEGRRRLSTVVEARTSLLVDRLESLSSPEQERLAAALPALWKLAELDPEIWPRLAAKPYRQPRGNANGVEGAHG